jgi:hypothetical protein
VDVAGKNNTWLAGVRYTSRSLTVDLLPRMEILQKIQQLCELENVVVAIDAQLSLARFIGGCPAPEAIQADI